MSESVQVSDLADAYLGGMSLPDVSAKFEIPVSAVRRRLVRSGVVLRTRTEGVRGASEKLSDARKGTTRTFTPEWRENISKSRLAWGEENAVGLYVNGGGYLEYTRGEHKGRTVHVVKMEQRLGRKLLPDENVHHIDEDKLNNDEDNLALLTKAAHLRLHRRERRLLKEAANGGC